MFDLDKKSLLARSTQAQHSGKNPVVSYPPAREVSFFGNIRHSIDIPSLPLYATLIYLTRLEALPPQLPSHIKNSREKNEGGPTAEDLFEFTQSCVTHYSQFPSNPRTPWPTLNGTRYKLGDLTGSWRGSWVVSARLSCFVPALVMNKHSLMLSFRSLIWTSRIGCCNLIRRRRKLEHNGSREHPSLSRSKNTTAVILCPLFRRTKQRTGQRTHGCLKVGSSPRLL